MVVVLIVSIVVAFSLGTIFGLKLEVKKIEPAPKPKAIPKKITTWDEVNNQPDGFLNLIKAALPKDKGLVYEIEVTEHKRQPVKVTRVPTDYHAQHDKYHDGDILVTIKANDPIRDELIGEWTYCERKERSHSYDGSTKYFELSLIDSVSRTLALRNKRDMIGHKEILS